MLREHGVDKQVLTFTTPGVHFEEPTTAVAMARAVNDAFAKEVAPQALYRARDAAIERSRRVGARARARDEATRVAGSHGLQQRQRHAAGVTEFEPLWKKANELRAVIYLHPAHPHHVEAMEEFWLTALVGFLFDTTLAAAHLVFAGCPSGIRTSPGC